MRSKVRAGLAVVLSIVLVTSGIGQPASAAETYTGVNCQVKYSGVDAAYARAIAEVYDTAHLGFKHLLSMKLPKTVIIKVETGAYQTQLFTDGQRFITLNLADAGDLNPNRGYFHIYGICQQMGLLSMYHRMSTTQGLPDGIGGGWGHYCGSLIVDYVWAEQGSSVWPGGWDYSRDGMARLEHQCLNKDKDNSLLAACMFRQIGEKYGNKKLGQVMSGALGTEPGGEELMGRFCRILDARTVAGAADIVPDSLRKSPIIPKGELIILPSRIGAMTDSWTDDDGFTGYDDDVEDGMRSTAGGGHIVEFHVEGGGELKTVRLKGARYGYPQSESKFTITVIDASLNVVQIITQPYMAFAMRGEPLYWIDFNLTGVEVTEDFYVLFNFNPGQTDGVYVGYDADSSGHSYSGRDMSRMVDFHEGDWMIRVKVE